jgi:hypothetical protein
MLITLLIVLLASSLVSAESVVINHTDRGWYNMSGNHQPETHNYFVGDRFGVGRDFRNFFVFDLAGVTQSIAGANLALFVPILPETGYESPDLSENYELHDIVTPFATLLDGTGGVAAHADLGSGVVYGSRTMTAADSGSVVEITLNLSAIAALDAATGLIGLGGSLTTLDAIANNEGTFGYTGFGTDISQLRLTLVPEPTSIFLLGMSIISLLGYRKAKS